MRCPPRRHLLGFPTHATQQYLDLRVPLFPTPLSPFFLIDGWVEVLAGWMHGCSVLFWFLKLALSFRTHATPLGPSAFHSVSSLFILFTPHPLVLNPAGRFCSLLGLRVCRREFLMLGIFCNFSLRTPISGIF